MTEIFKIYKFGVEDVEKNEVLLNEPHSHNYEELIIGIEGQIDHFIDFNSTVFNAPFISFVTKGKVHRAKPGLKDGKCDLWVIRFSSEFIPETVFQLYSYYHNEANISLQRDMCFSRLLSLCEMMHMESIQEEPDLGIIRQLLGALFTMIESERRKSKLENESIEKTKSLTFKNFLILLEQHYTKPEGASFYADKLSMSSRNLNLISQRILQQSVSEIIETRKLIQAKNLLTTTDMTISEIGFALGFSENTYFAHVFKKKSGVTPSEFRSEMKKLIS